MFRRILLPVDFSRHTERIMHRLPDLKPAGLEEVLLLHVINPVKAARWTHVDEKTIEDIKAATEAKLLRVTEELKGRHAIWATYQVVTGVTDLEIVAFAEKKGASLIIMGAHGQGYIRGMLLGGITEKVLRRTKTPLLIASFKNPADKVENDPHFFARDPCAKILHPTDFSENSLRSFRLLMNCRPDMEKEIILLHVQDTRFLLPHLKERLEEFDRIDRERLAELKRQLSFVGYSVRTILTAGVPFVEINRIADEEDVTMIAMASHGKSNIREALLGSVAEAVAQKHVRPVLIIPRD